MTEDPEQKKEREERLLKRIGNILPADIFKGLEDLLQEKDNMFRESRHETFCPYDNKYFKEELVPYLSYAAEWRYCAKVQAALMKGLRKFGIANDRNVSEMETAVDKASPADIVDFETLMHHDQKAVIREMSKFVSEDTAQLIHPGTTSYDILDTARMWAYKDALDDVILPEMRRLLKVFVDRSEEFIDRVQVGRTHGQWTSPTLFGYVLACYADRIADRIEMIENARDKLEGKISGIVGTGSSIGTIVGMENALEFERYVLEDVIGLKVCRNASQIVPKDKLGDLTHYLCSIDGVLADVANSFRHLQRSEINEITEKAKDEKGGGSSADPSKTNPINSENINGLWEVVISGIQTLYHMQVSDHQRDLRGSVQARFEPVHTMLGVYESTQRLGKVMGKITVYDEMMDRNLDNAQRTGVAEAMNAILKHYLVPGAYDMVKKWSVEAMKSSQYLLDIAMKDSTFRDLWDNRMIPDEKGILQDIKLYTGVAYQKTLNIVNDIRERFNMPREEKKSE